MTKWDSETDSLQLTCECPHEHHRVEFTLEDWAGPSTDPSRSLKLVVRVVLNPRQSFFWRVVAAFNYVFQRPNKYGSVQFDSVLLSDEEDIYALERLIKRFIGVKTLRKAKRRTYVRGTD